MDFLCKEGKLGFRLGKISIFPFIPLWEFFSDLPQALFHKFWIFLLYVLPYPFHQLQQPLELSEVPHLFLCFQFQRVSRKNARFIEEHPRSASHVIILPKDTVQQSCSITKNSCLLCFIQICSWLFLTKINLVQISASWIVEEFPMANVVREKRYFNWNIWWVLWSDINWYHNWNEIYHWWLIFHDSEESWILFRNWEN